MYFRFAAVVIVLLGLALGSVSIEKGNVALRRAISVQEYRRQQLQEQQSRLRLEVQRLSAPDRPTPLSLDLDGVEHRR